MKKLTIIITLILTIISMTIPPFSLAVSPSKKTFNGIIRLEDMSGNFFCSAFVVNNKIAYTAAHCIFNDTFWVVSSDRKHKVISHLHKMNERRDLATITGDFSLFEKLKIDTSPEGDVIHQNINNMKSCGYPYGSTFICYNISSLKKLGFALSGIGQLYSGMSGGPLMKDGIVYGVNHAVSNIDELILFQPLIGSESLME